MYITASNASIIRVTHEYMTKESAQDRILAHILKNFEDEVEQLRQQSDEELSESAETFAEYYLSEIFEDCDQALFIDGPVFENDLILHLPFIESLQDQRAGVAAIRVGELLEAGAVTQEVAHRESGQQLDESHELLVVSEMAGNGELSTVPWFGDIDLFRQTEGKQYFLENAHAISLLQKTYQTPYGVIKLFAGIYSGSKRDGSFTNQIEDLELAMEELGQDDLWSSGLYSMDVNHQGVILFDRQMLYAQVAEPGNSVFGLALGSYSDAEIEATDLFKLTFRK